MTSPAMIDPTMSDPKDRRRLIAGSATSYRPEQMRPFVESLRDVGYAGDVIMMVYAWDFALKSYLRRHGVTPLTIWTTRRLHGPVAAYRYQVYARLAHKLRTRYDEMMVTDTRDVLFQRHPFVDLTSPACHFYVEHPTLTIGAEPTNLRWATMFLPPAQVPEIARHRVSCNGIVLGGMAAMHDYLARMAADLNAVPLALRRRGGSDASIHHRLVFLPGGTPGVVMENNVHIATMGLESGYRMDDDGVVRTTDGVTPAILHQWDRVPHVKAAIDKRYS